MSGLTWVRDGVPGCPYNNWSAETPFGRILVTWKGWKADPTAVVDEMPGERFGDAGDPDSVRDAAEAEFWRRVRAAAEMAPPLEARICGNHVCEVSPLVSRCCEHGTLGCEIRHGGIEP